MKDAEEHASEDKSKRELIDIKNSADQLTWSTEKTLKEYGDKVTEDDRKKIQDAIEGLKKVKDGDSKEDIERAMEELKRDIPSTMMIAVVAKASGLVDVDAVIHLTRESLAGRLRPEVIEANVRALRRAYEECVSG